MDLFLGFIVVLFILLFAWRRYAFVAPVKARLARYEQYKQEKEQRAQLADIVWYRVK